MILFFIFLTFLNTSYAQGYSKGFGDIEWGTLSTDILKTSKTQKMDTTDCTTVFQQFLPSTNFRKHLENKRIFPGFPFVPNEEHAERKNTEIKMRYRVESDPRIGCKIYFDEKYFGHYLEKLEGRYQDFLSYYVSRWGYPAETEKDCEVPCTSKYRVYFFRTTDTHVLAQVIPYEKVRIFAYSKKIANEILGIMNLPQDNEPDSTLYAPMQRKEPEVNKEIIKAWSEEKLFDFALEKMTFDGSPYASGNEDAIYALETSDKLGHNALKDERTKLKKYLIKKVTTSSGETSPIPLPFAELKFYSENSCIPFNSSFCPKEYAELQILAKEFPTHPMTYIMLSERAKNEGDWQQFKTLIDHIKLDSFNMNNKWERLYKKFAVIQKMTLLRYEKKLIEATKLLEDNLSLFTSEYPYAVMGQQLIYQIDQKEIGEEKDQQELDRLFQKAQQLNSLNKNAFLPKYYESKYLYFSRKKQNKECISFFSEIIKKVGTIPIETYRLLGTCYERDEQFSKAAESFKNSCISYNQATCKNYFMNLDKSGGNVNQVTEEYCKNNFESACLIRALNFAKKKDVGNGFNALKQITSQIQGQATLRLALNNFTNEERELLKTVSEFQGEKIEIPAPDKIHMPSKPLKTK